MYFKLKDTTELNVDKKVSKMTKINSLINQLPKYKLKKCLNYMMTTLEKGI